jgi:hypothetical protein
MEILLREKQLQKDGHSPLPHLITVPQGKICFRGLLDVACEPRISFEYPN